jgi:hypothetical protein
MIKIFSIFILFSLFIFPQNNTKSNNAYQIEIKNSKKINNKTYEAEIYIKAQKKINLSAYQCAFTFNEKILNSGILKYEYVQGSSELNNKPLTSQIVTSGNQLILAFASGPGFEQIYIEKRIGTFRLTSTKDFIKKEKINLQWNFDGPINTIILGTDSKNITNYFNFKPKKQK